MRNTAAKLLYVTLLCAFAGSAGAADGLIKRASQHDVETTADRLITALKDKGMTVFDRIDHAKGASGVDLNLQPTEVVIFGNPKVGTPLMQCAQSVAIDLPQKALVWQDEAGDVWLAYNDPTYLAERHGIEGCEAVTKKIGKALTGFARTATGP